MCGILVKTGIKIKENEKENPNMEFLNGKEMLPLVMFLTSTDWYDYNSKTHT